MNSHTTPTTNTHRIGIDIGGTFTDVILVNEQTGQVAIGKVPTTPGDPSLGFLTATKHIIQDAAISPQSITYLVHATTMATNAIIEGKGAHTAFITTEGFRDLLEIQRQVRPVLYDVMFDKTPPLVPRYLAFEVPERLDARGDVLQTLDENAVREIAQQLKSQNVESVALCFLHAYRNPVHEQKAAAILRNELPDATVSVSSEIAPEFREYTRASTTVINALVQPLVKQYLSSIERRLQEQGIKTELLMMQSSGGVFSFQAAGEKPVFMIESGPAAGVIAASHLGQMKGEKDIISFDMGGTTAKASLIRNGQPRITKEYSVGIKASSGSGAARSSGYPINTPVVDLVEIGAGGGSLAWVDAGGILRVGPESAAADPGPACYGRGGVLPTVTDANLVLGRLDPDYFLGGEMKLDSDAAREAIARHCAAPLGIDVIAAAHGIIEIANAAMVNALRLVSVQHGYDPRDFSMIGFGGAGPLHANRLAAEMKVPLLLIPPSPGTFSAMGLLVTDLKYDFSMTCLCGARAAAAKEFGAIYHKLMSEGREALAREEIGAAAMEFEYWADMRYNGQSYELPVSLPSTTVTEQSIEAMVTQFHREHERAYGFCAPDEPVDVVNLRLTARGRLAKPRPQTLASDKSQNPQTACVKLREVYFEESGGFTECPVFLRSRLSANVNIEGPALIIEMDSTTVLHPGYDARVDDHGSLWIRLRGAVTGK